MPRYPRSYLNTSFFHVMTQGINKNYIFDNSNDIVYYINKMEQLTREQKIEILAYCIMNNHVHLLIRTNEIGELSKYMQRLNMTYGKYYNKKYNKVGFVFRDRYKSEAIYTESQLYNCIKYIANNPVKAGICKAPEEYPYSKYPKFDKTIDDEYAFIDTDESNEKMCREFIEEFLKQNSITLNKLKTDKEKLKDIVKLLKERYQLSFREIAGEMGLSKDIIYRIYNK